MTDKPWVALAVNPDLPISTAPVKKALGHVADFKNVDIPYKKLSDSEEQQVAEKLHGATGLILRSGYVTATLLDKLPQLKIIAVHGTGVDPVDIDACRERHVKVTNTPGANADAVAEHAFALMVCLLRRIPKSAELAMAEKLWDEARYTGGELRGKTLGLIGFGQIGTRMARIAHAYGMTVIASDPNIDEAEIQSHHANAATQDEVFANADILSLHAPAVAATTGLINPSNIAAMKRGALLINCARGALVNEQAVADALHSGQLAGAALDVMDAEPPSPQSPLFDAPNFLLTPHMAGSTYECLDTVARMAATDIASVLSGGKPLHPVS